MHGAGLRVRMALAAGAIAGFYAFVVVVLYGAVSLVGVDGVLGTWPTFVAVVAATALFVLLHYRREVGHLSASLRATDLPREGYRDLHRRTAALCASVDCREPRLQVVDLGEPNALALGNRIYLSGALLDLLDAEEVECIVAHELAHLRRRDVAIQSLGHGVTQLVVAIVRVLFYPVVVLSFGLAVLVADDGGRRAYATDVREGQLHEQTLIAAVLAMTVVGVFTRALSRYREFAADERAAADTGRPEALASALRKIEQENGDRAPTTTVPRTLCISGRAGTALGRLLDTHPPMAERIARLESRSESRVEVGPRVETGGE